MALFTVLIDAMLIIMIQEHEQPPACLINGLSSSVTTFIGVFRRS